GNFQYSRFLPTLIKCNQVARHADARHRIEKLCFPTAVPLLSRRLIAMSRLLREKFAFVIFFSFSSILIIMTAALGQAQSAATVQTTVGGSDMAAASTITKNWYRISPSGTA